jgi:hypothetical protein
MRDFRPFFDRPNRRRRRVGRSKLRRSVSGSYKSWLTVISVLLIAYFLFSLLRDIALGNDAWPIYIPGVLAGIALNAIVRQIRTDDEHATRNRNR